MRRGTIALVLVGAAVGVFALGYASAQEDPRKEYATPGAEHTALVGLAGRWKVSVRHWPTPDAEPEVSDADAVFTPLLEGRFLRQEFRGTLCGEAYEGIGCTGYNRASNRYEEVWIDSTGTGMLRMTGTAVRPGGSIELGGACVGPGGEERRVRTVWTKVGANERVVEVFCRDGRDEERKTLELSYTRAER